MTGGGRGESRVPGDGVGLEEDDCFVHLGLGFELPTPGRQRTACSLLIQILRARGPTPPIEGRSSDTEHASFLLDEAHINLG
jgi:hypothetical protein